MFCGLSSYQLKLPNVKQLLLTLLKEKNGSVSNWYIIKFILRFRTVGYRDRLGQHGPLLQHKQLTELLIFSYGLKSLAECLKCAVEYLKSSAWRLKSSVVCLKQVFGRVFH